MLTWSLLVVIVRQIRPVQDFSSTQLWLLPLNRDCGPSHATNDLRPLLMARRKAWTKKRCPTSIREELDVDPAMTLKLLWHRPDAREGAINFLDIALGRAVVA